MLLTDGVHLVSDTSMEELHTFARKIGLKRCWFHYGRHPHYDLFGALAMRAADLGIEFVTRREIVRRCVRPMKLRAMEFDAADLYKEPCTECGLFIHALDCHAREVK